MPAYSKQGCSLQLNIRGSYNVLCKEPCLSAGVNHSPSCRGAVIYWNIYTHQQNADRGDTTRLTVWDVTLSHESNVSALHKQMDGGGERRKYHSSEASLTTREIPTVNGCAEHVRNSPRCQRHDTINFTAKNWPSSNTSTINSFLNLTLSTNLVPYCKPLRKQGKRREADCSRSDGGGTERHASITIGCNMHSLHTIIHDVPQQGREDLPSVTQTAHASNIHPTILHFPPLLLHSHFPLSQQLSSATSVRTIVHQPQHHAFSPPHLLSSQSSPPQSHLQRHKNTIHLQASSSSFTAIPQGAQNVYKKADSRSSRYKCHSRRRRQRSQYSS